MTKIHAIRGMNDILPTETPAWQHLESGFRNVMRRYGYQEIRFPVLEHSELFRRSIGEVTDIVEKEMYSFDDRNGDNLSLRPEGTAGCVRAAEQHGLLYNQQQRLWYQGAMFRHERPQKGRYRQFHQFGVEAFGMAGPDIDAEVILLAARLWRELGIAGVVQLEINNIGSAEDRKTFGRALRDYLDSRAQQLDPDSQRRLHSNPLRILDSKSPQTQAVLADGPVLDSYLNAASRRHFDSLQQLLEDAGVACVRNPRLVRGLDYYNNCVFEWTTTELGAQGAVCAGGRYDGLVAQLGGRPTPAVGFACGEERLVLLLEACGAVPASALQGVDVYLAVIDDCLLSQALRLAESLRCELPGLAVQVNCGGGKYNSQLKKAFSSGASVAVVMELDGAPPTGSIARVKLRELKESGSSREVPVTELAEALRNIGGS